MNSQANLIEWKSTAGLSMKRWEIIRDDGLELGTIYPIDVYVPKTCPNAQFSVCSANSFKSRYVVKFETAIKWLERIHENIYPISRLNEFIQ